jgi:hypothetical protein
MTTVALPQKKIASLFPSIKSFNLNRGAIISFALTLIFLSFFVLPHTGILHIAFRFSVFFMLILPCLTFILSLLSIHHMLATGERGMALGYVALSVTALYLIVALAIPFVLMALYLVYTYIL